MIRTIRVTEACKRLIEEVAANIGEDGAYCFRAVCRLFNSGRINIDGDTVTIRRSGGNVVHVKLNEMYYANPQICVKVRTFIELKNKISSADYRKGLAAVCLDAKANTIPAYAPLEREGVGVDYIIERESED